MALNTDVEFVNSRYGKHRVKLLNIRREGSAHYIKEIQVNTGLTLNSKKDYVTGDNSDIVATDSQKNTIYVLAKQNGVQCPETFGLLLCSHFLQKYPQVTKAHVYVEEHPWKRITKDGKEHIHAFISSPECINYCEVEQTQGGKPKVTSGIKDLRLIKTTQSAFVNFVRDEYTSLPDAPDRIFSTQVKARWEFSENEGFDFSETRNTIKEIILDTFAGPPETGVYSPSVQQTLHVIQRKTIVKIPQIFSIELELPNIHYFPVDFSKLPAFQIKENNEIFLPSDSPSGNIYAKVERRTNSKL